MKNSVTIFAPASIANVGPFYDTMGFCVDFLGDIVVAQKNFTHREFRLASVKGVFSEELTKLLSADEVRNNVSVVADHIHEKLYDPHDSTYGDAKDHEYGIDIHLHKLMPLRSGLGSSAASCVATAKAIFALMGLNEEKLGWASVGEPMIDAEKNSSKHFYPDNILPSYYGGFHSMSTTRLTEINVQPFYTTIFMPKGRQNHTGKQRNAVEKYLLDIIKLAHDEKESIKNILDIARFQSNAAATVVNGFMTGNWDQVGDVVNSQDDANFLFQARCLDDTLGRTLYDFVGDKNCFACALSGSGPSYFALTPTMSDAIKLRDAVVSNLNGFEDCNWLISGLNMQGAKELENVEQWKQEACKNHNFW